MPINALSEFNELAKPEDFKRFLQVWVRQVRNEINNVLGPGIQANAANVSNNSTNLSSLLALFSSGVLANRNKPVVNLVNATNNVVLIRGKVSALGANLIGEGFTASRTGVGFYIVSFTSTLLDTPVVLPYVQSFTIAVAAATSSSFTINITNGGVPTDSIFSFLVAGVLAS
jgi:hypothetical protein